MTSQELGALGELWTMRQLQSAGLAVSLGGPADLLVEGLPVEVKTARPKRYRGDGRRGYQFCLSKPGHTDHRRAAVVILLAWWCDQANPTAFIIPSGALGNRRKVTIPNRQPWLYDGRWARYRGQWEVIADALEVET